MLEVYRTISCITNTSRTKGNKQKELEANTTVKSQVKYLNTMI
jgi:hypothetical protein